MIADDPEAVVAAVWAEVLEQNDLDPDTGFFDLGADSLAVVEAVEQLRETWPGLRVVDVFAHPTVSRLARFVTELGPDDQAAG
jgi:aryl carrier-like protein